MTQLLFLTHTPEEAKCYIPVDRYISSKVPTHSLYITQDSLYNQNVESVLQKLNLSYREIVKKVNDAYSYTQFGYTKKILTFIKAYREVKAYVNESDAVIFGAGNVVARAACQRAIGKNKLLFQIIPSYREYSLDDEITFYRFVKNIICNVTGLKALKNEEGNFSLDINKRFLPGKRTKSVFRNRGVASENIEVTGVPRFQHLFENKYTWKKEGEHDSRVSILYIMGSYLSHYDRIGHNMQKKYLDNLLQCVDKKRNNDVAVYIKLHPRNVSEVKEYVKKMTTDSHVYGGNRDASALCLKHDLIVSQKSTVSYQAAVMGCPVVLYGSQKERNVGKSIFNDFTVIQKPQHLIQLARSIKRGKTPNDAKPCSKGVKKTISPKTPKSHKVIGNTIIDCLSNSRQNRNSKEPCPSGRSFSGV